MLTDFACLRPLWRFIQGHTQILNDDIFLFVDLWKCFGGSTHHPVQDFAKNHVFPVQPRRSGSQDEELRPVGVRTGVRHAHLVHDHTYSSPLMQNVVIIFDKLCLVSLTDPNVIKAEKCGSSKHFN